MVAPAPEPANLDQHWSERCGTAGRDVCQEDAWLGGRVELERWGGHQGPSGDSLSFSPCSTATWRCSLPLQKKSCGSPLLCKGNAAAGPQCQHQQSDSLWAAGEVTRCISPLHFQKEPLLSLHDVFIVYTNSYLNIDEGQHDVIQLT